MDIKTQPLEPNIVLKQLFKMELRWKSLQMIQQIGEFAQAKSKMTGWIKEFGSEIEVVFSNNDDMALGAIEALKRLKFIM